MKTKLRDLTYRSPDCPGANRLSARSVLSPFSTEKSARNVDRRHSPWRMTLNGEWKFQYHENPNSVADDVMDPKLKDGKWDRVDVPSCWDMRGYDRPHYTNSKIPWGGMPPNLPENNPTGVYRRTFELPKKWGKRRTILHFDGVESCFTVHVNGQVVGFSKDSRGSSEFDVTDQVKTGTNQITVVVVKWSDASYVEDQDHWWHAGIVRSVHLVSASPASVYDLFATATLDEAYENGKLELAIHTAFADDPGDGWTLRSKLHDADGSMVLDSPMESPIRTPTSGPRPQGTTDVNRLYAHQSAVVPNVKPWTAETPNLYVLTVSLLNPKGKVIDVTACRIGFRTIEIKNRQLLINGQPVLINGVNRHEHDDRDGRTVSVETTRKDLETMKRFNVNAIRASHYPAAPEFYDLCDEYGLYVLDEANIENHEFYHDLSNNPAWANAYLDRGVRMVARDKNHPSVIIWSLCNESGLGPNQAAIAGWIRMYDPSRPLHCERACRDIRGAWPALENRSLSDIVSPMYPRISKIVEWAKTNSDEDRPLIMCEYSHAMGNGNGSLKEYYEAFERHHGLQGGFIWEWIDHGIAKADADGREYWAYGGDFGDEPNDANGIADGLVWPDRRPHPALFEFKKLAQPIGVEAIDLKSGRIRIVNKRYFSDLSDCEGRWELSVDGLEVQSGAFDVGFVHPVHRNGDGSDLVIYEGVFVNRDAPEKRNFSDVQLPFHAPDMEPGQECHLTIRFVLKNKTVWAKAGHEIAWEQFAMPFGPNRAAPLTTAQNAPVKRRRAGGRVTIETSDRKMVFSDGEKGLTLHDDDEPVILAGSRLNLMRAPVDNDGVRFRLHLEEFSFFKANLWFKTYGLDKFKISSKKISSTNCGSGVETAITQRWENKKTGYGLDFNQTFHVDAAGTVHALAKFNLDDDLIDVPRLGVLLELPADFNRVQWFGRGPWENYVDRAAGAPTGRYESSIDDLHTPYIYPQENGNRIDTRWVALNRDGDSPKPGLLVAAPDGMEFTVSRFTWRDLWDAAHDHELRPRDRIFLALDHRQRGLGATAVGPEVLDEYRIPSGTFEFRYAFRSLRSDDGDPGVLAKRMVIRS